MADADAHHDLFRFEMALASRDPDGIDGGLMSLIAEDFMEFGRSGRTWDRHSIREVLEGVDPAPATIEEFEAISLADGVALVTYRASSTNRSSIWIRRDGRWQLRFHQGTPVP